MKKLVVFLGVALVVLGSIVFFLFYRMGKNDARALADFTTAYREYDRALQAYSETVLASSPVLTSPINNPTVDKVEQNAVDALAELDAKSSRRISSLTTHDGDLMNLSHHIAVLAEQEVGTLKTYQNALVNHTADLDLIAGQLQELTAQRKSDFAHYLALAGINN